MISQDIFQAWRAPRVGDGNPTRHDNPLWASLVHDPINAYQVNKRFDAPTFGAGPTWCFDRFGRTTTVLDDGRTIHVAGEHEDSYDPDFYIYNDVVVVAPTGEVSIYGYPHDVFPPTDFHTATLLGDQLWLVGSLSYTELRRPGVTQVCRLELATMAITPLVSTGAAPGWLSRHTAELEGGEVVVRGGKIDDGKHYVENIDTWSLDLATLVWTRRTQLDWQRWTLRRTEGWSVLYDLRSWQWEVETARPVSSVRWDERVREATGQLPDLALLSSLYLCDGATALPSSEYNVFRIELDGVVVRFTEDSRSVAAMVEGRLSAPRLHALQQHVQARLNALENTSAWQLEA